MQPESPHSVFADVHLPSGLWVILQVPLKEEWAGA